MHIMRTVLLVLALGAPGATTVMAQTKAPKEPQFLFVQTAQKARFELTPEGKEFLKQEVGAQEARLSQAEAALQQFRQAHADVSPSSKDNLVAQRLLDTHQRLTNAGSRRLEAG